MEFEVLLFYLGCFSVLAQNESLGLGETYTEEEKHRIYFNDGPVVPPMSEEKILCNRLKVNYSLVGLNGRPVVNLSQPITVQFGLGLIQMDLDEKDKILTTSMWSRYKWKDEYLKWNPQEYGNVTSIKLHPSEIWKPDIMLYNTAETDSAQRDVLVVVMYDGTVLWVPHQIFRSSCSIDVTNFPFDTQVCNMWFGSWTYNVHDVDLQLAFKQHGIDTSTFMSDYKESCAWDIINNTAERKALPEEKPTYVVLAFTLKMKRKMVFSTYILTLPCVFLASLTLVVFLMPPERPDRTALGMSTFGSFLVLLLILVEAAPPTASSVPLLGVYYCFNMVIIMMSIFLSTLVINVSRGGHKKTRVPLWLKKVALQYLARIFCVANAVKPLNLKPTIKEVGSTVETLSLLPVTSNSTFPHHRYEINGLRNNGQNGTQFSASDTSRAEQSDIQVIRSALEELSESIKKKTNAEFEKSETCREWASIALVLDRFFCFTYLGLIVFSLIFLFPRPP